MKPTKVNKELKAVIKAQCLTLRIKGLSQRDIAAEITAFRRAGDEASGLPPDPFFSISDRTVGNWLGEALDELTKQNTQDAERLRQLEIATLNWAQSCIATQVDEGDIAAANTVIRLSESRRKLQGTDAPQKIAPTDPKGDNPYDGLGKDELIQRILERAGAAGTMPNPNKLGQD